MVHTFVPSLGLPENVTKELIPKIADPVSMRKYVSTLPDGDDPADRSWMLLKCKPFPETTVLVADLATDILLDNNFAGQVKVALNVKKFAIDFFEYQAVVEATQAITESYMKGKNAWDDLQVSKDEATKKVAEEESKKKAAEEENKKKTDAAEEPDAKKAKVVEPVPELSLKDKIQLEYGKFGADLLDECKKLECVLSCLEMDTKKKCMPKSKRR